MKQLKVMSQLNTMQLKDARDTIIQNIISIRESKDTEHNDAEKHYAEINELLEHAKLDGDTSENSAYETALADLAVQSGTIRSIQRQKDAMAAIIEPTYVQKFRSKFAVNELLLSLEYYSENSEMAKYIYDYVKEHGGIDNLDNSDAIVISDYYNSKVKELSDTDKDITVKFLRQLESQKVRPYNSCGKVTMYSCVRVEINGELYTIMIYPKGISYADNGIISVDTPIGANILGHEKTGEKITINSNLSYKIIDIY